MSEEHSDCIFCKIAKKEIPATIIAEGETWLAFEDLNPQAPFHALIIPKKHIGSLDELEDKALAGELFLAASQVAKQNGLEKDGYRVVNNIGKYGGQTVFHIHLHVLGKRPLGWPPG